MSPTDIVTNFQQWQKSMRRYVEKNVKEISYGQYMFPLLVASVSFFALQLTSQRMFGVVGLHCARPLATGIGFATTAVNMYGADRSALTLSRWANLEPPAVDVTKDRQVSVNRVMMGMAAFIILERGYFRTSLPSSVTEIGAFARNPSIHSIATKNSQASASEKKIVQELGKKYGCHHCGQRSFFGTNFIADHMPPNKIFADMPIRKRAMSPQRLWPQCTACFSKQGAAVRNGYQVLIYHSWFKRFHLAPAVAMILDSDPTVRKLNDGACMQVKSAAMRLLDKWHDNSKQ